jgi:hypothetical protein
MRRASVFVLGFWFLGALARAQSALPALAPESLRVRLVALAADSMGGRQTGEVGDWKAQEWIAAEFRAAGLSPAGVEGTYFQVIPFQHDFVDTATHIRAGAMAFALGRDVLPLGQELSWSLEGVRPVFAGWVDRAGSWVDTVTAAGRLLVFAAGDSLRDFRSLGALLTGVRQSPIYRAGAGVALVALERIAPDLIPQILAGRITTDSLIPAPTRFRPLILVTVTAARAILGMDPATAGIGVLGGPLAGGVRYMRAPLAYPARNVIAVLPGGDPALRGEYVAISAHHDHVGFAGQPVDHDSTYAYNRVVRPMGADSPLRPATPAEAARIAAIRDSLRRVRPSRPDSIFNGADDDGSGTVALIAIARALSAGGERTRPRRTILFVSHAAEERGLLGSAWFTDHPTVPRDSLVAEIDMDMIGRGGAADLPKGGPGYLEVVGSKRLSREFGELLERVNSGQAAPFAFNYEFDAPGHPLQYYCRADHYNYARYGIPSVSLSRGEHADYHQVTDESQYIDYQALGRVAALVRDFARMVADRDHRPALDGPRPADPHVPCRQ